VPALTLLEAYIRRVGKRGGKGKKGRESKPGRYISFFKRAVYASYQGARKPRLKASGEAVCAWLGGDADRKSGRGDCNLLKIFG